MNLHLPRLLIAAAVLLPVSAMAADDVDHSKHHTPAAVAPADKTPPPKPDAATPKQLMMSMQSMHEKMMQAKTQDEKQELAQEHMKMMHEGMAMMKKMSPAVNEKASTDMMQQKMEMMQMMMESMMDHMDTCMSKK